LALAGWSGGGGVVMRRIPSRRLQLTAMQYEAGGWRLIVVPAAEDVTASATRRTSLETGFLRAREPGRVAATCDVCLGLVGELGG
jgi:hypothetical protein